MSEILANHEEKFAEKQFNPFLQKVADNIKDANVSVLYELRDALKEDPNHILGETEYAYIGGLYFMVGIETMNQPYFNKRTADVFTERFERYNIDSEVIDLIVEIATLIKPENFEGIKKEMVESIAEQIKVLDNNGSPNVKATINMIRLVKQVFVNSILPVSYAVDTNKILSKKEKLTYDDVLKINTLVSQHCAYFGKNVKKALINLNSNQTWINLINVAVEKMDGQKYSYLYFDHIITFKEFLEKYGEDRVSNYLKGNITEGEYDQIVEDYKNKDKKELKPEVTEEEKPEETVDTANGELKLGDINNLMEENPVEALFVAFDEFLGRPCETPEDVMESIDKMFVENYEYIQNLYIFMKTKIETLTSEMFTRKIDLSETLQLLEEKTGEFRDKYKHDAEFVCQPIDENVSNRLITYVKNCINDLVLETDEQKNYLLSQLIEPNLETYNQVQQVVSLIETCKIGGGNIMSYVTLYDFLQYNEDLVEVFNVSAHLQETEVAVSVYTGFKGWFDKIANVVADSELELDNDGLNEKGSEADNKPSPDEDINKA